MADVLVDTDVFIDHLRGAAELRPGPNRLHYSVITRAELFAGNTATALAGELLAPLREVPVDRDVAERAGGLHASSTMSGGSGSSRRADEIWTNRASKGARTSRQSGRNGS